MTATVLYARDARGVAQLTLNRPERHNALDERLIADLTAAFARCAADTALRAVVLSGAGRSFCAGADIEWMKRTGLQDEAANLKDAEALARLFGTMDKVPVPIIARVQGAALGGGIGLLCCADIVLAAEDAAFAFSEVRLGITPATIAPYVLRAIGPRAAARWVLTGDRFGTAQALSAGLVHETVAAAELDLAVSALVDSILKSGPAAVRAAKQLLRELRERPLDAELIAHTCRRIAEIRASGEGREGLAAFLEKRAPGWIRDS